MDSLYNKSFENWTTVLRKIETMDRNYLFTISGKIRNLDFSDAQAQEDIIQNLLTFLQERLQMEFDENTRTSIGSEIQRIQMDAPTTYPLTLKAFDIAYTASNLCQSQIDAVMGNSLWEANTDTAGSSSACISSCSDQQFGTISPIIEPMHSDDSNVNAYSFIDLGPTTATYIQNLLTNSDLNNVQPMDEAFQTQSLDENIQLTESNNIFPSTSYGMSSSPNPSINISSLTYCSGQSVPMETIGDNSSDMLPESVFTIIEQEIEVVVNDIEKWKLNMCNEQRKLMVEKLDIGFLERVEQKASKIISNLVDLNEHRRATEILINFVSKLLVVVIQPSRVLQYNKNFESTVRLLFDGKLLASGSKNTNTVTLEVIDESRVPILPLADPKRPKNGKTEFDLLKVSNTGDGLTVKIHATIKENVAKRKNKTESEFYRVHDEAFFIEYTVIVMLKGFKEKINVSTLSHPIRTTQNSKQAAQAWATVIWDNSFSRFDISSYTNVKRPESQKFIDVVDALNAYFADCKRGLKLRDYEIIFSIIHPEKKPFSSQNGQGFISLNDFREDKDVQKLNLKNEFERSHLNITRISFFAWIFHLKKFISTCLMSLWRYDSIITGYLTEEECKRLLDKQRLGTFLGRFSNSTPNAVTVNWKDGYQPGLSKKQLSPGIYPVRIDASLLKFKNLNYYIYRQKRWKFHFNTQLEKNDLLQRITTENFSGIISKDIPSSSDNIPTKLYGYVIHIFLEPKLRFDR